MRGKNWIAMLALVLIAGRAHAAAPSGPYVGVGIGASNVSVYDSDSYHGDCCDYNYESGDADTSFSAHVGYRFLPYLAVEAGYLDAGKPSWHENFVYIPSLGDVFDNYVDAKMEAAQLSGLAILPFARIWEAYVKVGAAYWWADADQTAISPFNGASFRRTVHDDDAGFLAGFGIAISPAPHWNLRIEAQTYAIDEHVLNAHGDASLGSVLFEVQFRPRG